MEKLKVTGGCRLKGEVKASGAKNAALPILAASLLTADDLVLHNVPHLSDIRTMGKLLSGLGMTVERPDDSETVRLNAKDLTTLTAPYELVKTMRASIVTLGPMLARFGEAKVSLPGGCAIGARPVDQHIKGLQALGAEVVIDHGYVVAKAKRLKGAHIVTDMVTVTGTENLLMAATLAEGTTILENAAREPEVVDLANCLIAMGAKIRGAGTPVIEVEGVDQLHGATHSVLPDRIETGTLMIACVMCGGEIELKNAHAKDNESLIAKLQKTACKIYCDRDKIVVKSKGRPIAFGEIETEVYPGFPTDLQAEMCALACISDGYSLIIENLFESRFKYVGEFLKMGADIKMKNGVCVVHGKERIYGAEVTSTDLRGGAGLVLCGLVAEGYTTVKKVELIDRGYYKFEEKLRALGGDIKRIKCEKKVDNC